MVAVVRVVVIVVVVVSVELQPPRNKPRKMDPQRAGTNLSIADFAKAAGFCQSNRRDIPPGRQRLWLCLPGVSACATCGTGKFIYTGRSFMAESSDTKDMKEFQLHEKDTGSADVQVALLTRRIAQLTEHLKSHAKDHSSRRGLLKMVATRRSLLDYLSRSKNDRYKSVIEKLNLRK